MNPALQAYFDQTQEIHQLFRTAVALGLVGLAGRASAVDRDARRDFPAGYFRFIQIPVSTWHTGDVFAYAPNPSDALNASTNGRPNASPTIDIVETRSRLDLEALQPVLKGDIPIVALVHRAAAVSAPIDLSAAEIAQTAAAHGARTLFVLVPAPFQVDEAAFDQYIRGFDIDPATVDLDQPNRRMVEELSARG